MWNVVLCANPFHLRIPHKHTCFIVFRVEQFRWCEMLFSAPTQLSRVFSVGCRGGSNDKFWKPSLRILSLQNFNSTNFENRLWEFWGCEISTWQILKTDFTNFESAKFQLGKFWKPTLRILCLWVFQILGLGFFQIFELRFFQKSLFLKKHLLSYIPVTPGKEKYVACRPKEISTFSRYLYKCRKRYEHHRAKNKLVANLLCQMRLVADLGIGIQ